MNMAERPATVKGEAVRSLTDEAVALFWFNVGKGNGRRGPSSADAIPGGFWDRIDRTGGPDACWEWIPHRRGRGGYGSLDVNGRTTGAHRVAWKLAHGPIPTGMWVLHKCDNPPCCNPAHLFLGTNADNVADRQAKGRTSQGKRGKSDKPKRRHLRPEMVVEVRSMLARGMSCSKIGAQFGVTRNCIDSIKHGRSRRPPTPEDIAKREASAKARRERSLVHGGHTLEKRRAFVEMVYEAIVANPWIGIEGLSKIVNVQPGGIHLTLRHLRGLDDKGKPTGKAPRIQTTGGRKWMRYAVIGAAPLTAKGAAS